MSLTDAQWARIEPLLPDRTPRRADVEGFIDGLKQWRGLAARCDKTATIYLAGLHIAAVFIRSAR
ncbi:hypothetical protein [Streptomyces wedmorensis]|uniref:hypothetical protein n=1 Tax=Streptomyces wedmorensis TaxID=43759 RepID=UPI003792599C